MRLVKPLLAVSLLLFVGVALSRWQARASRWQQELQTSSTLTLYSLDPTSFPSGGKYLGHFLILGQTSVSGAEKKKILAAIRGAAPSDRPSDVANSAACSLMPRLGVESEDKQTRVLVCFSCGLGQAVVSGAKEEFVLASRRETNGKTSEDQINAVFKEAKVPVASAAW